MSKLGFILLSIFAFQSAVSQTFYQKLFEEENYNEVIQEAKKELSKQPTDSLLLYYLGSAYTQIGEPNEAISYLLQAKENGYQSFNTDLNLAKNYVSLHKLDSAFNILKASASKGGSAYTFLESAEFETVKENETFQNIYRQMKKNALPCKFDSNYRRFDFWVGEWNVYVNGKKIAESTISHTNGDCGILENYRPLNQSGGHSISYYDGIAQKWKQEWVAWGIAHHYKEAETPYEGDMQLITHTVNKQGEDVMYRMTFTALKNGNVRQFMELSKNEEKTWTPVFDGLYKPANEK